MISKCSTSMHPTSTELMNTATHSLQEHMSIEMVMAAKETTA